MPRPGTDVSILDDATPGGPSLNTGQAFFVGQTAIGPTDEATKVGSLKQYATVYGARSGGADLHDAVNAFFQEGGGVAYVASTGTVAVTAALVAAALDLFPFELGPGQVCAPGLTDPLVHTAVLAHIDATTRCALLDAPDDDDPTVVEAAATALAGVNGVRFAALFGPRVLYPSSDGTSAAVLVPYSGVQAGMQARADALGNPNQAAGGINGVSRLALGLSQTYTDDDRETLNTAGITLGKMIYGDMRTYGARTAAGVDDERWLWFPNSRVVMAIAHEADAIAQNYVLRQVDGRRQLFAAFESDLRGMLLRFYNLGALYGASPPEAFDVDTGPGVNTVETIAAGEVHAVVRVKTSPTAEWVAIAIVKVPLEVPIAA
jgi:hypothetical protein